MGGKGHLKGNPGWGEGVQNKNVSLHSLHLLLSYESVSVSLPSLFPKTLMHTAKLR